MEAESNILVSGSFIAKDINCNKCFVDWFVWSAIKAFYTDLWCLYGTFLSWDIFITTKIPALVIYIYIYILIVIDTDESLIISYRYFVGLSVTSQMSWVQMRILANQIDAGIVITWPELKSEFGSGQVGAVAGPRLPHADAQFVTGTLSGKNTISCFIYHWNFANYFVYLSMP